MLPAVQADRVLFFPSSQTFLSRFLFFFFFFFFPLFFCVCRRYFTELFVFAQNTKKQRQKKREREREGKGEKNETYNILRISPLDFVKKKNKKKLLCAPPSERNEFFFLFFFFSVIFTEGP